MRASLRRWLIFGPNRGGFKRSKAENAGFHEFVIIHCRNLDTALGTFARVREPSKLPCNGRGRRQRLKVTYWFRQRIIFP